MSVRFVNSNVPYAQGGIGTFDSIQAAINASAPGDSVVLEDNQVYDLGARQIILKNGVDLLCRNGTAQIQSTASFVVGDNNVACICSLINLYIFGTSNSPAAALFIQHINSKIYCTNVLAESTGTGGVASVDIRGYCSGVCGKASGAGGYGVIVYGTADNIIGFSNAANAYGVYANANAKISNSLGYGLLATSQNAIFCETGSLVSNSTAISASTNTAAFQCHSRATDCIGISTGQTGFNVGSALASGIAAGCTGISLANGGPGTSVGMNISSIAGGFQSKAFDCRGFSLGNNAGEGLVIYPNGFAFNCVGYSEKIDGLNPIGGTAINSSGISDGAMGIACFNSLAFGGANQGARIVNCSGYSAFSFCVNVQGNDNTILGGSFVCDWNNAAGHGISITGGAVTGTIIKNASIVCLNAGASSIAGDTAGTGVNYAGVNANRAVNGNIVQASAIVTDAQGNNLG